MDSGLFKKEKEMTQDLLFLEKAEIEASTSNNLDQGYASETLVLGWLLKNGHEAIPVPGQKKSDIWIGYGKYLCRLNVKSSGQIKDGMVRGLSCGGRIEKIKYSEFDIDILSLVWTESLWPLYFHISAEDRKHVSAEPKMFTLENSLTTFEIAFSKFKERKCQ